MRKAQPLYNYLLQEMVSSMMIIAKADWKKGIITEQVPMLKNKSQKPFEAFFKVQLTKFINLVTNKSIL